MAFTIVSTSDLNSLRELDPVKLNLDGRGHSNTGFRTEHKMTKEQQNDVTEPSLLLSLRCKKRSSNENLLSVITQQH